MTIHVTLEKVANEHCIQTCTRELVTVFDSIIAITSLKYVSNNTLRYLCEDCMKHPDISLALLAKLG